VGGELAGEAFGDINASIGFAKDAFSAKVLALCSGLKAGPFFKGADISATYAPKFGSFTIGGSFLDPVQADALGAAVAAVPGASVYAKATVNY